MTTAQFTTPIRHSRRSVRSKFVGAYYLLTILTGAFILFFHGKLVLAADAVVGICYLAVTALLYGWSESSKTDQGAASAPKR